MSYKFPELGAGTMLWTPKSDIERENYFKTYKWCLDHGLDFFVPPRFTVTEVWKPCWESLEGLDGRSVKISSKFAPPSSMNPVAPKEKR